MKYCYLDAPNTDFEAMLNEYVSRGWVTFPESMTSTENERGAPGFIRGEISAYTAGARVQ